MKALTLKNISLATLLAALASPLAFADHNSPWGEGWASMPNDIHNTRLDDDVSDTEFMEFVQGGGGADSVNRYLDDDDTSVETGGGMSDEAGGSMAGGMGMGMGQGSSR